jgi:hypothetical protein
VLPAHWRPDTPVIGSLETDSAAAISNVLTTVRDNLRHASVSTTLIYLHSDEVKRAQQIAQAFGASHPE